VLLCWVFFIFNGYVLGHAAECRDILFYLSIFLSPKMFFICEWAFFEILIKNDQPDVFLILVSILGLASVSSLSLKVNINLVFYPQGPQ